MIYPVAAETICLLYYLRNIQSTSKVDIVIMSELLVSCKIWDYLRMRITAKHISGILNAETTYCMA